MAVSENRALSAEGGALSLADDMMRGADAIRVFMFGEARTEKEAESNRRSVYHLADKHGLPCFRLGGIICARKSTLMRWIEAQEGRAA